MAGERRTFLALALASALTASSRPVWSASWRPQDLDPPPLTGSQIPSGDGRMTVPVFINGRGPFAFVVDCAAEASVVSSAVADRLGLAPAGDLIMHTIAGAEPVQVVQADAFTTGVLRLEEARLVRVSGEGLGQVDGLLGADLLAGHRLVFRFGATPSVTVEASTRERIWPFSRRRRLRFDTPTTRMRGGLLTVRLHVGRTPVTAILDTGSARTIVNSALESDTRARPVPPEVQAIRHVVSPTGAVIGVTPCILPPLRFGGMVIRGQVVVAADLHTFRILGLADRPTMLVGMDVLSVFRTVVVDPHRRELILSR